MSPHGALTEEIETLVQERQLTVAQRKIALWLKQNKTNPFADIQAANWYRRMGKLKAAFQVLTRRKLIPADGRTSTPDGKRLLWIGFILNILGASQWAMQTVRNLTPASSEDHFILASIFADNYYPEMALPHFEKFLEKPQTRIFKTEMALISAADTLAALRDFKRAHEILSSIEVDASNTLLKGILIQVRGEYYARAGFYQEAFSLLESAEPYFPKFESAIDRVILYKWRGYVRGKLGNIEGARSDFEQAIHLIEQTQIRPEVEVDIQRMKYELGLIDDTEWARSYYFPGLIEGYYHFLSNLGMNSPSPSTINFSPGASPKNKAIQFDLIHGDVKLAGERFFQYGLTKEDLLLSSLVVASPRGVSLVRLKSILWPEQTFNFFDLDNRLFGLFRRLATQYQCEVHVKNGLAFVSPSQKKAIQVRMGPKGRPRFLFGKSTDDLFTTADAMTFYGLSATSAKALIKTWKDAGLIESQGLGKNTKYVLSRS